MTKTRQSFERRKARARNRLRQRARGVPRLSVFRSHKHIYAQVVDDEKGITVAAASSLEKAVRERLGKGGDKNSAGEIGRLIAERAKGVGVTKIVFDRGGYLYHGRVKALADGAREGGLEF